jgi:RimJ/RimL family protein N-acetyltransferase
MVSRIDAHQREHGFCLFAAELVGKASFIGFIGLSQVPFEAPFTPAVEIGWRLARPYWHKGLATEGAQAVLSYAFRKLNLDEVVSFTTPANIRSRRVMEKIGLKHDPEDDFDHPRLPAGHPLRRHVLYRLNRPEWEAALSANPVPD